jgi:hypothetical protein
MSARRPRDLEFFTARHQGAPTGMLVDIPTSAIVQLPPGTPYGAMLCPDFNVAEPSTSCRFGSACTMIHADTSEERPSNMHINYAWRCPEDVSYRRFPAGPDVVVALPRGGLGDAMNVCMLLETEGLRKSHRHPTHCAHYFFNRMCIVGHRCRFIHAVYIDPNAQDHQIAPRPVEIGLYDEHRFRK